MQKETPAAAFPSHTKLVFLVSVMLLMNYIDRGNLATAAPLVKTELQLDDAQLGLLLSSFYWTYVAFMIPAPSSSARPRPRARGCGRSPRCSRGLRPT